MSIEELAEPLEGVVTGKPRFGSKGWHTKLIWVVCLCLVVAVVAALGGFQESRQQRIDITPGTKVSLNNAEIRILGASAKEPYSVGGQWNITVFAEIRNVSGQPLQGIDFNDAITIGYINGEGAPVEAEWWSMSLLVDGNPYNESPRSVLPPFGDFMPVQISLYTKGDFNTSEGILVGMYPLAYIPAMILGLSDAMNWRFDRGADHYWVVAPPVEIIETEF